MLNNARLREAYARLGIAEATRYDAGRLSNPGLSLAVLDSSTSGAGNQINLSLVQHITDLILLRQRKRAATRDVEHIRLSIAAELFQFTQDVRAAYFDYAAAEQQLALSVSNHRAMALMEKLARRYYESGNIGALALDLAEAEAAKATLAHAERNLSANSARYTLGNLLGLTDASQWHIRRGFPVPNDDIGDLPPLESIAATERLDIDAAKRLVAARAARLRTRQRFRFLGELEAGIDYERETDHSRLLGPSLSLELPIFNRGAGRILRAQAELERDEARLTALKVSASNQLRTAFRTLLSAHKRLGIYQSQYLPARKRAVHRTQELQNFMLASPFQSLRAKAAEYEAYSGYIDTLNAYWHARITLSRAVGKQLSADKSDGEIFDVNVEYATAGAHESAPSSKHSHGAPQ